MRLIGNLHEQTTRRLSKGENSRLHQPMKSECVTRAPGDRFANVWKALLYWYAQHQLTVQVARSHLMMSIKTYKGVSKLVLVTCRSLSRPQGW